MASNLFKQRKNKRFNYTARYTKDKAEENDADSEGFLTKWKAARDASRHKDKRWISIKMLIFILIVLLVCMYLLESKFR